MRANTEDNFENKIFNFNVKNRKPQIWNCYTGKIYDVSEYDTSGNVGLSLKKNESLFVVFPLYDVVGVDVAVGANTAAERKNFLPLQQDIKGTWRVTFIPKTDEKSFTKTFDRLVDFSKETDFKVKYFSGTAVYENTFIIQPPADKARTVLDLGKVCDIAEVEINGVSAGVLWIAPFEIDITDYVKTGSNTLKIKVTNTWQNRLIGDEQFPADFESVTLENSGEPSHNGLPRMKGLPEWVHDNTTRPSKNRKTFIPWNYFSKNSALAPAGLLGGVKLKYIL